MSSTEEKIFLVGNPNVGKSVLFGHLTGAYATVSNYPGTTVTLSKGSLTQDSKKYQVIDTPGINSLLPMSDDERVTRDLLLAEEGIVVQVADAKNLLRALSITLQLQEMEVPLVFVINMWDEAAKSGIAIDSKKLEALLGVPVVTTVAIHNIGVDLLKKRIKEATCVKRSWRYSNVFSTALNALIALLPPALHAKKFSASLLLSGDRYLRARLKSKLPSEGVAKIDAVCQTLAQQFAEPVGFLIHQERKSQVQLILKEVVQTQRSEKRFAERLGGFCMHPFFGWVALLGILELVYLFVGKFGAGTAVDFIENGIFNKYISPAAIWLFDHLFLISKAYPVQLLHDAFVGEYGLITMGLSYGVAIVLPIVATFFIAFSLMEDSGYLPRLAIMVNRFFQWMGLNGKAVLPMVLGLGCDTMATLTTRILETKKQRLIVTLLLALAVPCSAQLGILLGMFGKMPVWTFWVWLGVMMGVMFLVGFASNKIFAGESSPFLMEIPPLRLPQFGNVAKKTLGRLEWYVKEAIPLFLLGTLLLFILDTLHLLQWIQKIASPLVVKVLGLPAEASNAFLIGFLRRDYGATGFFDMFNHGSLSVVQALIALVVITLFVPCIANVFMIMKEHGGKIALRMVCFIFPFAFLVGGILNWILA